MGAESTLQRYFRHIGTVAQQSPGQWVDILQARGRYPFPATRTDEGAAS